jgi:hypothetical protein
LTYFFSFTFAFIGKCEKREAQSRRTMRPSLGRAVVREVGEQEREREFDSTKRAILHAESA